MDADVYELAVNSARIVDPPQNNIIIGCSEIFSQANQDRFP